MNAPTAPSILEAGLGHMKDRAVTYDKPQGERSMGATIAAFNAVTGHQLTEEQGWLFQVLLKAVRSQQGAFRLDCYEDGAAYFGLMGEAAFSERVVRPMLTDCLMGKRDCTCERCAAKAADPVYAATQDGFDEARADAIGQNGNDGEHYAGIDTPTFARLADQLEPPQPPELPPLPPPPATCNVFDCLQEPIQGSMCCAGHHTHHSELAQQPAPAPAPKAPAELPATDNLVDPTGRPKWEHVPDWVKWLGQDRKGVWTGFTQRPEPRAGRWHSTKRYAELNSGEPLVGENWVHTLEERP